MPGRAVPRGSEARPARASRPARTPARRRSPTTSPSPTPTGSTSWSRGRRTASARGSIPRRRCRAGPPARCAASGCRCGATAGRCATGCSSPTPSRGCGCWPSGGSAARAYNLGPAAEGVPNVEIARMVARAAGGDAGRRLSERVRPAPARPPLRRLRRSHRRARLERRRTRSSAPSPRRWPGTAITRSGGARSCPTRSGCMPTEIVPSPIDGVRIWRPQVHADPRGRFVEVFRSAAVPEAMAQSNHSRSAAGALRGLHYHRHQADLWYLVVRPRPGRAGRPAPARGGARHADVRARRRDADGGLRPVRASPTATWR